MKKVIHSAETRGYFDHGWLKTYHTFSFASYFQPDRVNFGKLRVLNDDVVAPKEGFGTHPHDNMEIVSIPLLGALAHKDSEGHEDVIETNDVQVMSAGTGIWHSEYNHSDKKHVNFLQIWVLPDCRGHEPQYNQKSFDPNERKNQFQTVVAPKEYNGSLWLNQDAYFSLADIDTGNSLEYSMHTKENGVYLFVIEGEIFVGDETLSRRDGIGIWEVLSVDVKALSNSKILLIEVPMN